MNTPEPIHTARKIYIIGAGAIGMSLAVSLVRNGRCVTAIRTSRGNYSGETPAIAVQYHSDAPVGAPVEMRSLSRLENIGDGIIVITAKATANKFIASELKRRKATGPVIILQNGIGVEAPFIETGFSDVYRCVLYATSQGEGADSYSFRSVAPSPIGAVLGNAGELQNIVELLDTPLFHFRAAQGIREDTWKKAIMNAVFNSICPLLDVDNGIFHRDESAAALALEMVREALEITRRIGLDFQEEALMEQLMAISRRSEGQLISTLQDLKNGNETEIEFLNLEMARIAGAFVPAIEVSRIKILGELVLLKSKIRPTHSRS